MRATTRLLPRGSTVETLALIVVILAVIAALGGLFWPGGEGPYTVTTYRGQEEEIFGRGIYRDSSVFNGAGARGTDVVTLLLVVPMIVIGLILHWRGSIRGTLLLAGGLTWTLYVYASMSLGTVAYNDLFLLHVTIFAVSLWALVMLLTDFDMTRFGERLLPGIPQRGLAIFLIASGAVTSAIWLIDPMSGLIAGEYPELLGVSTTMFTNAFDIAIIAPAVIITGLLVQRGRPAGYLFAVPLLILEALLAPMIVAQTLFQREAGVDFTPGQIVVMIGGFVALAVIAIWMVGRILGHIDDPVEWRPLGHRHDGGALARQEPKDTVRSL
jgi:hypothetical protein